MTYSIVQTATIPNGSSGSFGSNVTIGNSVLLVVGGYVTAGSGSSSSPVYDSGSGNTNWTQLETGSQAFSGSNDGAYISAWLLPAVTASGTSLSITTANISFNAGTGIVAYEIAGLGSSPTLDGASTNDSGGSTSSTASSGTSGTTAQAIELIIAGYVTNSPATGDPASPWIPDDINTDGRMSVGYQISSSTGTFTYSHALSGTGSFAGLLVCLYSSGGGTPANVSGAVANVAVAGVAGTPAGAVALAGAVSNVTVGAPAGTPAGGSGSAGNVSGVTANVTVAALAGTPKSGVALAAVPAAVQVSAPAGTAGSILARVPGQLPTIPPMPAGHIATASDMNELSAVATFLLAKPFARISDVSGGVVIGSSPTQIQLNGVTGVNVAGSGQFDTDGMWNASLTSQLTVVTPGWYIFRYGIVGGPSANMVGACYAISVTGANNPLGSGLSSGDQWASGLSTGGTSAVAANGGGLWPFYMYAGDYWEVYADATGGTVTTAVVANLGASFFEAEFVSAT